MSAEITIDPTSKILIEIDEDDVVIWRILTLRADKWITSVPKVLSMGPIIQVAGWPIGINGHFSVSYKFRNGQIIGRTARFTGNKVIWGKAVNRLSI